MSIYGNMPKEEVANLSQEEKNKKLMEWILRKPTKENIYIVSSVLAQLGDDFWEFFMNGIIGAIEIAKEPLTKENIAEYIEASLDAWFCDLDDFWEYIGYYIEDRKPKTLIKVTILS